MHWLSTRIVIAEMGPFLGLWLFNFFQMPMKQTNKIKFYEEKSPDKNLPRHIQSQSARTVHCINRKFEFHIWSRSEDRLPVPTTKPTKSIYLKLYYSGVHKYFELLLILLFWSKMVYLCFPTIIATLCIILHIICDVNYVLRTCFTVLSGRLFQNGYSIRDITTIYGKFFC